MKINAKDNNKTIVFCLVFLIINIHLSNEVTVTSSTELNSSIKSSVEKFMLMNTFLHINNNIKTKGDLILDYSKKGVIFKLTDGKNIQKINNSLRDYTIKQDEEYLIDFRLVDDCSFKLDKKNNSISISVNKLENKLNFFLKDVIEQSPKDEEDDNFLNIKVKFFLSPHQEEKILSLKDQLVFYCKDRKQKVGKLKQRLLTLITKEYNIQAKINKTKKILSEKNEQKDSIDFYLEQTNQFLKSKNSLKEMNSRQIDHLVLLKNKSIELKQKELNEKDFIQNQLSEIKNTISYREHDISIQKKNLDQLEKELNSLNEEQNNKKKELINLNKNYFELEEIFSSITTEKENIENDLTESKRSQKSELGEKAKLLQEVEDVTIKIKETNFTIDKKKENNSELEKSNQKENVKITEIEKKINELTAERKKIVFSVKSNLDVIKNNYEEISKDEMDVNEHNYKISLLKINISDKEKRIKDFESKNKFMSNKKNEILRKFKMYQDNLHHSYKTKDRLNEDIKKLTDSITEKKTELEKRTEKLDQMTSEKSLLESKKTNLTIELKRIESDITNNDIEIRNFEYEIKKRKLKSEDEGKREEENDTENQNTTASDSGSVLNAEYSEQKNIVEVDLNKLDKEYKKLIAEEKSAMNEYITFIEEMMKNIPEIKILLHLMTDDLKSNSNLNKIKNLIDLIKN